MNLAILFWVMSLPCVRAFVPAATVVKSSHSRVQPQRVNHGPLFPISLEATADDFSVAIPAETLSKTGAAPVDSASRNLYFRTNVTLTFPSYFELMDLRPGECVLSDPFSCPGFNEKDEHNFQVKLYPRGGGHGASNTMSSNDGFGMAYKVTSPLKGQPEERVGMYLQYLGKENDSSDVSTVDATFALRLKGRQRTTRKFDLEWRAGMRFVPSVKDSNLKQGLANDFGAHLMQTSLLKDFLGVSNDDMADSCPVTAEVEVTIHNTALEIQERTQQASSETSKSSNSDGAASFFGALGRDIRRVEGMGSNVHDTDLVRVGRIVVPILSRLSQRPKMFEQGAYPGVEYRILRILKNGEERFTSCPGADYELKPIYPLVQQLERPWPVTVNESDIPRLYTPNMYNVVSAVGSLFTAVTGLFTAFVISQAVSLFFIPSKSMDPTLQVGDVLLVDKVSPRIFRQNKVDDIILFSPPRKLQEIVAKSGGKLSTRDLFVKRIAASPGDKVTVKASGEVTVNDVNVVDGRRDLCEAEPLRLIERYIQPVQDEVIDDKEVFVMGDCSSVSVDSRVWGPLETKQIVGKPILRLWPLKKFGPLQ
jgi:signal peptidase I